MIEYIKGILAEKEMMHVAVECAGVGYSINIPISTFENIPDPGMGVKLFIHYHMREDAVKLYGFFTKLEREIFRHLIGISKIGPKVAVSILSGVSVEDLITSVNTADSTRLEKVPGVGAKTAQRLVMELKGKLGGVSSLSAPAAALSSPKHSASKSGNFSAREEAFAAMISLGYNEKQVGRAFSRVEEVIEGDAMVEDWVRKALQVI
ncbi:Holliday junction DNA helicase RuvA [Chitinispirillum alkaliphilum]|nr:Holliday junction DNA helicase RuvA [Chitinispirillum alkaliphilum]